MVWESVLKQATLIAYSNASHNPSLRLSTANFPRGQAQTDTSDTILNVCGKSIEYWLFYHIEAPLAGQTTQLM